MDVLICVFVLPLYILIIVQTSEAKSLASLLNQTFDDVDFAVESETKESVKEFSEKHGCTFIEKVTSKYYHIKCKEPKLRVDDLEQKMQESARNDYGIKSLERQYYHMHYPRTNDPEWSKMWYLNGKILPNTKVTEVWKLGLNGSGITIAVLDDGIQVDHPDLINNIDISDEDLDVTEANAKSHGTAVAGIIAAEANNNVCIVGVAHASKIIEIIVIGKRMYDVDDAKAFSHKMEMVDIYSNSWGPNDDGNIYAKLGNVCENAMKDCVTEGRNRKGAIIIFAAGNGGLNDNCNADGYTSNLYTIPITSIAFDRSAATYSEVCATAFAATYSGDKQRYVISTSVDSSCVDDLAGTSFSAPQASAIVALALQANPSLTWRDVQYLIVKTSKRHDIIDGFEEQSWQINGAGFNVSQIVGFGLMDAEAMVLQAKSWTNVNPQLSCSSVTMKVNKKVNNLRTGNGPPISNLSSLIEMGKDCGIDSLEKVQIEVSLLYEFNRGDITLILESPSGTLSFLMTPRPNDFNASGELTWNFTSVHFWGEEIAGTWKLLIKKKDFHDTSKRYEVSATLNSWKLYFCGISKDANNNQKISGQSFPQELMIIFIILSVFAVCGIFGIAYIIKYRKIKCKRCRRNNSQPDLSQEEGLPLRSPKSD